MQEMIHKTKAKTHLLTALLMPHRAVMLPERSHRLVTGLTGSRCQVLMVWRHCQQETEGAGRSCMFAYCYMNL